MKKILTISTICGLSLAANAQSGATVQGAVVDGSTKTVGSATISLLRAQDSTVVKYAVADRNGRYSFDQVAPGRYLVSVTAVGHARAFSSMVELTAAPVQTVATIQLIPVSKDLAGVTVTARKPLVEQKIDRTVLNVDAAVTNVGATALEVLEKAPGVSVDKDGNLSLKGRSSVQVMIDGRPSYLSETALANYLKTLPASAIEQIEIMTNPSARYDASGNSGIINIRTKKNKLKGFNGSLSLSATQGKRTRANNSFNLNYRSGKMNLFGNFNHSHYERYQNLDILRHFREAGNLTAIFEQTNQQRGFNNYWGAKAGADFFLSKKTTIGIVFSGATTPEQETSVITSYLKSAQGVLDSIIQAQSNTTGSWKNGSVNLNFRHSFDSTGRELTADIDLITYRTGTDLRFLSNSFNPGWVKQGLEQLRGDLPVQINIYSGKADYTQSLAKGAKLEAGIKGSYVRTQNGAFYFNNAGNSEWVDTSKTNQFNYEEQISAAYLNLNRKFGNWGVQAGLRYEHTSYSGHQFGSPDKARHADSTFHRNYGSLFPTLFVSYAAGKDHQLTVSYGRRIDRPSYQDLNPFLFFLDKYTYEQGNPFMRPQFTDNIELGHTFKGVLTTTLNWGVTRDLMNETFEQARDENGAYGFATIVKNGNIGRRETAGASVSAQLQVRKWWSANLYANYNFTRFSGRLNTTGDLIDVEASNGMFNGTNQFSFGKGWNAELSGWYRTRGVDGQLLIGSMAQVNAGIGKTILKGSGSVKLGMRDIFLTNKAAGEINFQGTEVHFWQTRDTRTVNASFTWRFGKPVKDSAPRRRAGAASDEVNRVKGAQ
jgi:iron complex outermembrane receptor protein